MGKSTTVKERQVLQDAANASETEEESKHASNEADETASSNDVDDCDCSDDAPSDVPMDVPMPHPMEHPQTTRATVVNVPQNKPRLVQRAANYIDSYHGLSSALEEDTSASNHEGVTDLFIWRLRCLIVVAWSTGFAGATLVPLYLWAQAHSLATVLGTGSLVLLVLPFLLKWLPLELATRILAGTSLCVMTVLTVGSGGFPLGLAPGIQRILPILVLCFGSLRLGQFVTLYVMVENVVLYRIGPLKPVFDDAEMLELIMLGSWMMQPVLLFLLGVSLHVAGSSAIDKLHSVSDAKTRFLSIVSHELRTPLHGILGLCDLALSAGYQSHPTESEDSGKKYFEESLRACRSAAKHLSTVVDDLLLYSSSKSIRIQRSSLSIQNLLTSTASTLAPMSTGTLIFEPTPAEIQYVTFCGDDLRLRQCLYNVIGNALKFCSSSDRVTVSTSVVAKEGSTWTVQFKVQDTGPGISKKHLNRIFAPFEQTRTTPHSLAGVGLGLSIVAELIEKMHGSVRCESVEGQGTTMYLVLPLPVLRIGDVDSNDEGSSGEDGKQDNSLMQSTAIRDKDDATVRELQSKTFSESNEESDYDWTQHRINASPHTLSTADIEARSSSAPVSFSGTKNSNIPFPLSPNASPPMQSTKDPSPIVFMTISSMNLEFFRNETTTCIDAILFDSSAEAAASAAIMKAWSLKERAPPIPLLRIQARSYAENNTPSPFDTTIHPCGLAVLARRWFRALALGAWILVVDDVSLNRKILSTQCKRLGHRVSLAANGLEGLEAAEAAGFAHDMIAMDLMMPVMDGHTAAANIKERERHVRGPFVRLCPIFSVTAGMDSMKNNDVFDGILRKPTSMANLKCMIRFQVIRRLLPITVGEAAEHEAT